MILVLSGLTVRTAGNRDLGLTSRSTTPASPAATSRPATPRPPTCSRSSRQSGGSVTTSGNGANAVFAYGTGSAITIADTKISATGQYAHGIMASGGGSITAKNLSVNTTGASSAAVATDRGGGTIKVSGGTYTTAGVNSPGLYSTGTLTATDATFIATGAEAVVVEGSNTATTVNSTLTGTKNRGVMLYQSFSGDAQGSATSFTATGGSVTALAGPLFFITNTTGTVNLRGVKLSASSGTLLDSAASSWGTAGSNGGKSTINANAQALSGAVIVDKISTAALNLSNGSTLTGAINTADSARSVTLSLDSTSTWKVTANSYLTTLSDSAGISGASVKNIIGNGHTVHYQASSNPSLGGRTYTLAGGGTLIPA
jgi:hypothetical protein